MSTHLIPALAHNRSPSASFVKDEGDNTGILGDSSGIDTAYAEESDDMVLDHSESDRPNGASFSPETAVLKEELSFFHLSPLEKFKRRKQTPWKLLLQIFKIFFVTAQILVFGQMRSSHITFLEDTRTVFRHIFLKNWDATRDILVYPPVAGPYSVYLKQEFYDHMLFALQQYYEVNETAIGSYGYSTELGISEHAPPVQFCIEEYRKGIVYPQNGTFLYDTHLITKCAMVGWDLPLWNSTENLKNYLKEQNVTVDFDKLYSATLNMTMNSIHLRNLEPYDSPECFRIDIQVVFDNSKHNGRMEVKLEIDIDNYQCSGKTFYADYSAVKIVFVVILDVLVLLMCSSSFVLCARAMINGQRLRHDFDSDIFIATGVLLGGGCLLVWCGILRYFNFFSQYNVLILTMKKSAPNIFRFVICSAFLYLGFVFCGWAVLGPYNYKFRSLFSTSDCLFSLINGDDMFATFSTTDESAFATYWFGKVYLYVFITLFIYIVLSLFIAIILDAYEIVKEKFENRETVTPLQKFLAEPVVFVTEDNNGTMVQGQRERSSVVEKLRSVAKDCIACSKCKDGEDSDGINYGSI